MEWGVEICKMAATAKQQNQQNRRDRKDGLTAKLRETARLRIQRHHKDGMTARYGGRLLDCGTAKTEVNGDRKDGVTARYCVYGKTEGVTRYGESDKIRVWQV